MSLGLKIREERKKAGLSQEQLAEKLNVSRQAITKWETDRGIPDIGNLIAISDEFGLSLDELIKEDFNVKQKIVADSSAKKWHVLVIVYLTAIVAYVAYFAICRKTMMVGFLIATLFMLFFELRIFIKEKIYRQDEKNRKNIGK
ncbi:MAG: helix-turn-helix domain-containing protein [Christensenellaceae bacterium]